MDAQPLDIDINKRGKNEEEKQEEEEEDTEEEEEEDTEEEEEEGKQGKRRSWSKRLQMDQMTWNIEIVDRTHPLCLNRFITKRGRNHYVIIACNACCSRGFTTVGGFKQHWYI